MLGRTIVEKKRLEEYEPLKEKIALLSQKKVTPTFFYQTPLSEEMIQEYLLFENETGIVGVTYLEGMKDTKNCSIELLTGNEENQEEIIEESTNYAINDLGMLDVNWLNIASYEDFYQIAKRNHYEISPPDPEIVVLSASIQKELEQRKNR